MQKPLRIVKNGNAASVCIPRPVMRHCGLQLGDLVVVEVTEDRSLVYRRMAPRDLQPDRIRPFLPANSEPVKP